MSEKWAYCASCQRSYYLTRETNTQPPDNVRCPVCRAAPTEIEVRDDQSSVEANEPAL